MYFSREQNMFRLGGATGNFTSTRPNGKHQGSFSLIKTCNIWVNKALKETGVPTSVWSPFDFCILYYLPK